MKFIVKIFMFTIIGVFFLIYLPFFLLIALGFTLVKYGKEDDPFMEIAKESFGEVFGCFNPIKIVFKKD